MRAGLACERITCCSPALSVAFHYLYPPVPWGRLGICSGAKITGEPPLPPSMPFHFHVSPNGCLPCLFSPLFSHHCPLACLSPPSSFSTVAFCDYFSHLCRHSLCLCSFLPPPPPFAFTSLLFTSSLPLVSHLYVSVCVCTERHRHNMGCRDEAGRRLTEGKREKLMCKSLGWGEWRMRPRCKNDRGAFCSMLNIGAEYVPPPQCLGCPP